MDIRYELTSAGVYHHLLMYVDNVYVGCSEYQHSDVYTIINKFDWFIESEELHMNQDITYIQQFYILQEFRGKGYSHILIRKTLANIRKDFKNPHICLIVEAYCDSNFKNTALYKLYKRHKFLRYRNSKYMFIYKKKYPKK